MLLELSTTHKPASDLGFLLHKNPARVQSFELAFGVAHVLYPEASAERCTVALLLDVDPFTLAVQATASYSYGALLLDRHGKARDNQGGHADVCGGALPV